MKKAPPLNTRSTPRSSASASPNRSQSEPEERINGRRSQRSNILEAAVDLFAKGGSRGTPMAAIAERIGVSIPAITHHFGSKYGLFVEVIAVSDSIDELRTRRIEAEIGIDRLSAIRFWAHELASDPAIANLSRLTLVMTAEALDADFSAHEHFVLRHQTFSRPDRGNFESGPGGWLDNKEDRSRSHGNRNHGFCPRHRPPVAPRSGWHRPGFGVRQLLRSTHQRCRQ